jgi:hypothetical protein
MENDKRIEEVMSSIDSIKRAEANPFLYEKIMYRMKNGKSTAEVQPKFSWQWALAACVIVGVNIGIWAAPATSITSATTDTEQFAESYFTNNIYTF